MKKLFALPILISLLTLSLSRCKDRSNHPTPPPAAGAASISITNIEIRPNPYHLYPAPNFKAGNYDVIVSVQNTGTAACSSSLFFTLSVLKADQYGNFNSPQHTIGGATLSDAINPKETKNVTIAIDNWLTLATAQGDFNTVAGTYRVKLSVKTNDATNISQTIPEPLFQVVRQ